MAILKVKVIMRAKHIAGHNRGEFATMLLSIAAIHHINHPLGIAVAEIAVVRRTIMHHGLINRVGCLIWKNAGGQAGYDLLHSRLKACLENVVIDEHILSEEIKISPHIVEQPTNLALKSYKM